MKTLLFDLDGTLIDPKVGIVSSIRFALTELGLETSRSDSDYFWCIGPPLQESFITLTESPEQARQALQLYRQRYSTLGLYENEVFSAIPELLSGFSSRQYQMFVATSKPHVYARKIVQYLNLEQFFRATYGSELDGTRANKVDLLAYIVEQENLKPDQTLMIGDRKFDILGARANGIKSIGVAYGYGGIDELEEAGADFLCRNPTDLPSLVSRLSQTYTA